MPVMPAGIRLRNGTLTETGIGSGMESGLTVPMTRGVTQLCMNHCIR